MFLFWLKIILTVVLILGPIWLGAWIGRHYKKEILVGSDHSSIGSIVSATLGLYAFMLAISFQIASSRFDTRKQLFVNEVVAMRATYQKAGLLKDSNSIPIKRLLKEYIDLNALLLSDFHESDIEKFRARSKEIINSLWTQARALANEDRSSEVYALFISSVNELDDLYNKKIGTALYSRVPKPVLWVLCFIGCSSMLILGFQIGISGKNYNLIIILMALTFAAVMWLIFALDSPTKGFIRINPQPIFDLQKDINAGL